MGGNMGEGGKKGYQGAFEFTSIDIAAMQVKVKFMSIMDSARGRVLTQQAFGRYTESLSVTLLNPDNPDNHEYLYLFL